MTQLNAPKIVLVMPDRLGDAIFRIPLFSLLKKIFPNSVIDVIAPTSLSASVLAYNPAVRRTVLLAEKESLASLSSSCYDFGIDVADSAAAQEGLQFVSPKKIFRYKADPRHRNKHISERLLVFIANCFGYDLSDFHPVYQLFPQKEHIEKIHSLLYVDNLNQEKIRWVGFHLGCHGLAKKRTRIFKKHSHSKAWPLEKFIKLAKYLQHLHPSVRIVLTGVQEEEKIGRIFCKKIAQTLNLINKISILELTALLNKLDLFITNDTGPLHVACATDVNLIALFGKTDAVLNGPYPKKKNRIVLQKSDVSAIEAKEVLQLIEESKFLV